MSWARFTFEPNGDLRVRRRVASQALRSTATDVGLGAFHFDTESKMVKSRAWHLPAHAKRAKKTKRSSALDITPDDLFLSDSRTRFISVGDLGKGSLVFFEFESVQETEALAIQHLFYEGNPTTVSRLVVDTSLGMTDDRSGTRSTSS